MNGNEHVYQEYREVALVFNNWPIHSTSAMICQFSRQYFTVWPSKFTS